MKSKFTRGQLVVPSAKCASYMRKFFIESGVLFPLRITKIVHKHFEDRVVYFVGIKKWPRMLRNYFYSYELNAHDPKA